MGRSRNQVVDSVAKKITESKIGISESISERTNLK